MILRLGTRGSLLARTQAGQIADRLRGLGHDVEMIFIKTEGDRRQDVSLAEIGGKGLFLKELEEALLDGRIDFAVHSLKDVPGELAPGLTLAAYTEREDVRDAWISRSGATLKHISAGARVGTGSLRRGVLLRVERPDLEVVPMRGNVDTRLAKLAAGEVDAILLAAAGLRRLDKIAVATELLDPNVILPAPGQGVLGLECRADRGDVVEALSALDHPPSNRAARAERALLAALGGDCRTPLAAWARATYGAFRLDAAYEVPSTKQLARFGDVAAEGEGPEALGRRVADRLRRQ